MANFFSNLLAPFSTGPAEEASAARERAAQQGYGAYSDLAGQARNALQTNYTSALLPYQELYETGRQGYSTYADATGANGPEGLARARANFQASPGFDFQLNTGIDALTRAGKASGQATGNTLQDALKYGTGLAQQDWGNYVSRLQPFIGAANTAASGISGTYQGLGTNLANSFTGQGQAAQGMYKDIGQAQADAALAPYQVGKNIWGAIGNAASLAMAPMTGGLSLAGGGFGNTLLGGMIGSTGGAPAGGGFGPPTPGSGLLGQISGWSPGGRSWAGV